MQRKWEKYFVLCIQFVNSSRDNVVTTLWSIGRYHIYVFVPSSSFKEEPQREGFTARSIIGWITLSVPYSVHHLHTSLSRGLRHCDWNNTIKIGIQIMILSKFLVSRFYLRYIVSLLIKASVLYCISVALFSLLCELWLKIRWMMYVGTVCMGSVSVGYLCFNVFGRHVLAI